MVDAFEAISFLTRSENRVAVLEQVAAGRHTQLELVDETGVSDVMIGRILEDFTERGWAVESGSGYETTWLGDLVADDYARLRDSMDLSCRFGPVRAYLPIEAMEFDLRHLADARISDPDTHDVMRAVDRWLELIEESDRIIGTAYAGSALTAEATLEAVRDGQTFEMVMARPLYDEVRGAPRLADLYRDLLRAGATMYLEPDGTDISWAIALCDDIAAMAGYDEQRSFRVGVESRADPVRRWVRETYTDLRADSRQLTPADFGN
jgi:predicted transcriptional regulator